MLGIFISHGGRLVKEKYNLLKGTPKRKISSAYYRHTRDVVDKSLSMERKLTYETFQFRGLRQRAGEKFSKFMHRCEMSVDKCGFNVDGRERHIRDQFKVLGTISESTRGS